MMSIGIGWFGRLEGAFRAMHKDGIPNCTADPDNDHGCVSARARSAGHA